MDAMNIFNNIISFILILYGEPTFSRKLIDIVINFMNEFLNNVFLKSLETSILDIVKNSKDKNEMIVRIQECLKQHGRVFENCLSEHDRFNVLKTKGFIMPQSFEIRQSFVEQFVNNKRNFVKESVNAIHVPLRHSLKFFLNVPGLAKKIIENVKLFSEKNDIVSNVMQAKFWLTNFQQDKMNEYLLPLFIYYDEIEVGNPLGAHAGVNKFGVVYASIACLPAFLASRLSSIIFSTLVRAKDKKESTNENVFKHLIEELQFLQSEGITVMIDGISTVLKFQLVLILGDNLGLNEICGFVQSFVAHSYCRICRADKFECSQLCTQQDNLLRTVENYDTDVLQSDSQRTGIKERCVFNFVNNFNVVINRSVDFMHDVLEGVCVYVIRAILYEFIFVKSYFTLEQLNQRINNFACFSSDSNKPPPISTNQKNKINLKYSASEMLYLTRYLGLIIGDLIPSESEHWKLYVSIRKIVDILMSPRIVNKHIQDLISLIKDLNCLYVKLYENLKPKFHFLTHYPTILYMFGPCIHFWCMRYESKHRDIKANAQSKSSKKNLLQTIALKQALKMCQVSNSLDVECEIEFNCISEDDQKLNSVTINGSEFNIGKFIVISMEEPEVKFGEITGIIKKANTGKREDIDFIVNKYEEIYFDNHVMAYIVEKEIQGDKIVVSLSQIPAMPPVAAISKNDKCYIVPPFVL